MAENSVQGVQGMGRVDYPEPTSRTQSQNVQPDTDIRSAEASGATRVQTKEKVASQEPKPQAIQNKLSDVRLKFQVDPKTNDVTVLVLDKASKKVIRTIPPEDIRKLNEGDLFELMT
jgi:uncharacterized FlaG/YvyC family protein